MGSSSGEILYSIFILLIVAILNGVQVLISTGLLGWNPAPLALNLLSRTVPRPSFKALVWICVGTNSSLQLFGFMVIDFGILCTKISNIYLQFSSSPRYLLKVAELFEKLRVREVLEKLNLYMWVMLCPVTYKLYHLFCRKWRVEFLQMKT